MKANAITRIVLYSVAALVLLGILIAGIAASGLTQASDGITVNYEASVEAEPAERIEIDWACGSVVVKAEAVDRIIFRETASTDIEHHMTYSFVNGTLKLDYGVKSVIFGFNDLQEKHLVVVVPLDWVGKSIEIDGASLGITLTGLTVGELELDGASCDLHFSGSVDEVSIDGASADVTLNCINRVSSIEVDGASCKLELILPKDCGYRVRMEGLSCNFHSDLEGVAQNGTYTYGDQCCKVNVDGISCDVTVKEQE